jgi:hypothetical protein
MNHDFGLEVISYPNRLTVINDISGSLPFTG